MWVHPHHLYATDWSSTAFLKPREESDKMKTKGKLKCKSCNMTSTSLSEIDSDAILYTNYKDEEEEKIAYSAQANVPVVAVIPSPTTHNTKTTMRQR